MKYLSLIFALFYIQYVQAQANTEVDSLINELTLIEANSHKVEILNELAFLLRRKDSAKAKSYANEAKLISQNQNNKKGEATAC